MKSINYRIYDLKGQLAGQIPDFICGRINDQMWHYLRLPVQFRVEVLVQRLTIHLYNSWEQNEISAKRF